MLSVDIHGLTVAYLSVTDPLVGEWMVIKQWKTNPASAGLVLSSRRVSNRRSQSEAHCLLVVFVVLVAAVVFAVVGLIAGVVAKNHQISMALMVSYSLGNSLLSSR